MAARKRYALALAALLLLAVTAVGVAAAASRGSSPSTVPATTTTTVDVPADTVDFWVDTHIAITAGETFSIKATGTVNWDDTHPAVGPTGLKFTKDPCAANQYADPTSWAATGINCYSLVGQIVGDNNSSLVVFLVGSKFKLKSPVSGELQLGFNDDFPYDNSGDFTAVVTTP
jgi:hypothetical protein